MQSFNICLSEDLPASPLISQSYKSHGSLSLFCGICVFVPGNPTQRQSLRCVTPPPKFAAENLWNRSREEDISFNFSCDWHLRPVSPARRLSSSSCWMSTCLILSRPSGVFQKHLCFQSSSIKNPAEMQCNLNMLNIKRVTSKTFRTSSLTLTEARTIMHKPVGCVFGTPTFLFFFRLQLLKQRLITGQMSDCTTTSNYRGKKMAALCHSLITSIRFSSVGAIITSVQAVISLIYMDFIM